MKVIVTARIKDGKSYLDLGWRDFLEGLGHTVMVQHAVEHYLEGDLLILSGGNDINGYNGNNSLVLQRDTIEHNLIKKWVAERKPILGICRGFLLLNLYYNGTITKCKDHDKVRHTVTDTNGVEHLVNSHHRHKIETLANKLNATAIAHDSTVEAFQHNTLPIYGIMWHPERQGPEGFEYYLPDGVKELLGSNT